MRVSSTSSTALGGFGLFVGAPAGCAALEAEAEAEGCVGAVACGTSPLASPKAGRTTVARWRLATLSASFISASKSLPSL